MDRLRDADPDVRMSVIEALHGFLEKLDSETIIEIQKLTRHDSRNVREAALKVLCHRA
jgi:HEAT repeat protein